MVEGARGGKADGPRPRRGFGDGAHLCDVLNGRRLPIRAALAHDEHPQGRVRQLRRDIDVEPPTGEVIEIVGKTPPVPGQPFGEDRERNVLDTLHQVDKPVVILRPTGGEADPAIAHHGCGHAMQRRGLQPLIPGRLTVIVGVNVHESRCDQQAPRVDLVGARARDLADRDNQAIPDRDITLEGGGARPVHDRSAADHTIILRRHGRLPSIVLFFSACALAFWGSRRQ